MTKNLIVSSPHKPFDQVKRILSNARHEIVVIAPYIQSTVVKEIIPQKEVSKTIITTWRLRDLIEGFSDLNLYQYCQENKIHLFLNSRIHLKSYISDWKECIIGSSNLTNAGMGLTSNFNYEFNSHHSAIDLDSIIYLKKILLKSYLVDDHLYSVFKEKISQIENYQTLDNLIDEISIEELSDEIDQLLISFLPMTSSVTELFQFYTDNRSAVDSTLKDCATHDLALYDVPCDLSEESFYEYIRQQFFASPFIVKLLGFIGHEGRYFGEMKEWVQRTCKDVPVPSRRELTGNIQVLYKWITFLSDGKYIVERPNYSERIRRID